MRILIVDDHAILRRGIREILDDAKLARRIGEAARASEALELLASEPWDLVLLDLQLPDSNGSESLQEILHRYPNQAVLIVSSFPEEQYAVRMITLGARGYLHKETAPDELLTAVSRIAEGKRYISHTLAELMADGLAGGHGEPEAPPHTQLSARELEVFNQLAVGISLTEIGENLSISVKTVSTYRTRVLRKLNLERNAELTIYAANHGLIDKA